MEVAISYYSKEIQETKSQNYRISYRPYLIESIILIHLCALRSNSPC